MDLHRKKKIQLKKINNLCQRKENHTFKDSIAKHKKEIKIK